MSNDLIGPDPLHRTLQQDKEIDHLHTRIAELEQVIEIIADTSSSVDTRDIAEDALNRIRGNDE
jgi:hypothetical protein